jgi:hypothetical protein
MHLCPECDEPCICHDDRSTLLHLTLPAGGCEHCAPIADELDDDLEPDGDEFDEDDDEDLEDDDDVDDDDYEEDGATAYA